MTTTHTHNYQHLWRWTGLQKDTNRQDNSQSDEMHMTLFEIQNEVTLLKSTRKRDRF